MESEREKRVQTVCLLIISSIAVAFALYWLRPVLLPFVLALFLAIGLKPLVNLQVRRLKFPRKLAVITTLLLSLVVLAAAGLLVTLSVRSLLKNKDVYETQINKLIERGTESIPADLMPDTEALQKDLKAIAGPVIQKIAIGTTDLLSNGVLVIIFLGFLLFGSRSADAQSRSTWIEIESRTRHYIVTKAAISVTTGICIGLILWLTGVSAALVFGLMALLLNFIPNIGSFIATLLPLPMVLLTPDCTVTAVVLVIVLPMTVQTIIGNVIEPRLLGQSLRLHAITVLMALIFWGALWGIAGMFLAVPLTAILRILLEKSELTLPAANLLGGRFGGQKSR